MRRNPAGPASLAELEAWSTDPAPPVSSLGETPYLLFDACATPAAPAADRVAQWLRQLPCSTLALAPAGTDNALTRAADVMVERLDDALGLIANIRASPLAAAVLVQTLRVTERLPIFGAFEVESLAYATLQGGVEFRRWLDRQTPDVRAAPPEAGPAVVATRDGDALQLELNRAGNRNALNREMRDALVETLQLALADASIKRVHVSGRGKCFSVGGDLTEFGTLPDAATAHAIRALTLPSRYLARCADRVECSVHGACIGSGVEIPAFARRVVAAQDTFFQLPELKYGLIPGAGGCVSLPRRIGRQRTAWLVLSGKRISATKALEWSLIDGITG